MNDIDIKNIKKELNLRAATEYEFEDGGTFSQSSIVNATTEELKKMVKDFSNDKKTKVGDEIKKLVDEAFEKFGKEGDNMIILGACNYWDEDRCVSECDDPLKEIDFDGFDHDYNKLVYPIGRGFDLRYWDEDEDKYINGKDDDKYVELSTYAQKIESLLPDLGLKSVEDYCEANNDAINECWYGVHGITKDYKIVAFVIRDDGMLCDEDSLDSFHNSILCKL